jgi:putative glutamine amidotransferase
VHPKIAIPQPRFNADEYNGRSLPQYLHAIKQAGGEPVVVDLKLSNVEIAQIAKQCDAVCLPGSGADVDPEKYGAKEKHRETAAPDPARDNADELLLQDAYNMRKPVLGICYGVQSLNVWRTGTLVQHIESRLGILHEAGRAVPKAHTVNIKSGSHILGRLAAPVCQLMKHDRDDGTIWRKLNNGDLHGWVNSSHHQSVEHVGDGLAVVAVADDGVIEAVESTSNDHWVLGIQWHPERGFDEDELSKAIFRGLIQAAWDRKGTPRHDTIDFEAVSS